MPYNSKMIRDSDPTLLALAHPFSSCNRGRRWYYCDSLAGGWWREESIEEDGRNVDTPFGLTCWDPARWAKQSKGRGKDRTTGNKQNTHPWAQIENRGVMDIEHRFWTITALHWHDQTGWPVVQAHYPPKNIVVLGGKQQEKNKR